MLSPEQFGEDAHYRRQVPMAPTDEERLELKREDAGFAFELNHLPMRHP